ncbi:MAG: hypothetical protein ABSA79_00310 [Candidatus Bathyarchaeia archaeon]|jgi:hypothetical protein
MINRKLPFYLTKTVLILVTLFIVAFIIYWVTGPGYATNYNYYVRLADAFLHGRLYLLTNPSWLNELIPNPSGVGYYVVYPPLPAFLMTPLVAIFGVNLNQTLFGLFFGAASVPLAYLVAKDVTKKPIETQLKQEGAYVWFAVLFGFSTLFWYLTSIGSVWLIAQVISAFFLFLALHESFNKNRSLLVGLLVGASFWCRLPTILGIFFFAGLAISRQQNPTWKVKFKAALPSLAKLAIGAGIFVIFDMIYNFVRFGSIFDVGYWMIPGILNEPWFNHGLFSLSYITDNLRPFLTGFPTLTSKAPFIQFPMTGIAIWVTTPAFIFALKSKIKDPVTWWSWLAIISIAFVIFTKGLSGWGFGYRYAMDFYPFLFVLTVKGMGTNLKWYHKLLIILGVIVNMWGVIAINKFPNVPVLV